MAVTIALQYDAARRRADLRLSGGTLALDATPQSPALVSLLADRRARPDDPLPMPEAPLLQPDMLDPRRGWCGDALDPEGRRTGSRLWLLQRAKETEATRRRAEDYAREALAWATPLGLSVTATWLRAGWLHLACRIGREEIAVERAVT